MTEKAIDLSGLEQAVDDACAEIDRLRAERDAAVRDRINYFKWAQGMKNRMDAAVQERERVFEDFRRLNGKYQEARQAHEDADAALQSLMAKYDPAAEARIAVLTEAANFALEHVEELEEAWRRGTIQELDHWRLGGERSNRNVEVRVALRAALSGVQPKPLPLNKEGWRTCPECEASNHGFQPTHAPMCSLGVPPTGEQK